ncbi:hypothetical protein TrCOL_g5433 [Triparma columacea]|uniref:Ribosomal protein S18 n=1 Tax=Triparma columacea TaxID=722753 RepID=A0A9W7LF11_9STRA|nr:hypothetical protein TrCOL_g5433 [Triparma columacea]
MIRFPRQLASGVRRVYSIRLRCTRPRSYPLVRTFHTTVPAAEEHRGSKFLPEDFDEVVSFDPTTLKVEEGEEDAGDAGEADGGYTADRNPEKDYLASLGGDGDAKEGKGPRGPSIFGGDDSNEFSIPEYYNDEKFAHLNDKQLAQLIQADYEAMTTIADFGNEEGWPITPDGEEEDPEDTRNLGRENEKAWMAHMDQSPTFEEDNQIGHDVDFGLASQYFEPEKMEKDGKYIFNDTPPTPTDFAKPGFKNRKDAMKIDKSELRHTNLHFLQQFVGGNGEILSRRVTGLSAKDQRKVAKLIKRARHMGLVPTVGGWSVKESGIYLLGKTQASMQEGVGGGGGLGEEDSGLGN